MRFDGGIFFGREPKYGIDWPDSQIFDQCQKTDTGIALATHWEAVYFDMESGNERMRAIASAHTDTVVPLAVVNPTHYDCTEPYVAQLKNQGFAGVACFPLYQSWSPGRVCFQRLVKDVSAAGLPLQVAVASGDELALVIAAVRSITTPVLIRWIRGGGYAYVADMIAIAKECPHIYFDVGNLVSVGGIEYLAKKIGAHRLYVATNMPVVYEASAHLLLDTAGCTPEEYEWIAYKTLASIFQKPVVDVEKPDVLALPDVLRPKIDIHWHGQGWDIIEPKIGLDNLRTILDTFHYDAVIVSSILALNYDIKRGNEETARWTEVDPRIHGYVVIDPTRPEESIIELETYKHHPGFVGMKTIQDFYPRGLDHRSYQPMLAWAAEHQWPILCHRAGSAAAAKQFPTVQFILAHMTAERMPEFVGLPNVWSDISASYAHRGETNLPAIVEAFGSDKVLFAVDGPLMSPAWSIGKIVSANIAESQREQIYYQNARRLFPRLRLIV